MWLMCRLLDILAMDLFAAGMPTVCVRYDALSMIQLNQAWAVVWSAARSRHELWPSGACSSMVHKSLSTRVRFWHT